MEYPRFPLAALESLYERLDDKVAGHVPVEDGRDVDEDPALGAADPHLLEGTCRAGGLHGLSAQLRQTAESRGWEHGERVERGRHKTGLNSLQSFSLSSWNIKI